MHGSAAILIVFLEITGVVLAGAFLARLWIAIHFTLMGLGRRREGED